MSDGVETVAPKLDVLLLFSSLHIFSHEHSQLTTEDITAINGVVLCGSSNCVKYQICGDRQKTLQVQSTSEHSLYAG